MCKSCRVYCINRMFLKKNSKFQVIMSFSVLLVSFCREIVSRMGCSPRRFGANFLSSCFIVLSECTVVALHASLHRIQMKGYGRPLQLMVLLQYIFIVESWGNAHETLMKPSRKRFLYLFKKLDALTTK